MKPQAPHKTPDPGWCGDPARGASMGRYGVSHPGDEPTSKFTLQRVYLDNGGYDQGGAYWGGGTPLYWFATDDGEISDYLRAGSRESAKAQIREKYPDARFYR